MTYHYFCSSKNKAIFDVLESNNYFLDKKLNCVGYDCATILNGSNDIEGGVIDKNNNFVSSSAMCEYNAFPSMPKAYEIQDGDEIVIYIGVLYNVYGHIITDGIKKLWFLFSDYGKSLIEKGAKIAYVAKWDFVPDYVCQIFDLLGIKIQDAINVQHPTKFPKVYIPDNSFIKTKDDYRYYTKEYVDIIKRIKNQISKYNEPSYSKIYYSRTKYKSKREFGERAIEVLFEKMAGYKIVHPEEYSFTEQLQFLSACKSFASTEGSISHNALFLNKGTEIILLRKANYINSYQHTINQIIDASVNYVDVGNSFLASKKEPYKGPFYIIVSNYVVDFFKTKFESNVCKQKKILDKNLYRYIWNAEPVGEKWHRPSFLWFLFWSSDWQRTWRQLVKKVLKL